MSAALQLFRSAIEQGAPIAFRECNPAHLLAEEVPIYEHINSHFRRHGRLPAMETLAQAGINLTPAPDSPQHYLAEVRRRFSYNNIARAMRDIMPLMQARQPEQVLAQMAQCVRDSQTVLQPQQYSSLDNLMETVEADYQLARANMGRLRGIPFGFPTLDEATLGAQAGDIIVFAGRPGMGKSYVLLKAVHSAWMAGHSVAFVSMEMSLLQIGQRWLSIHSGINPRSIKKGELPFWVRDQMNVSIQNLRQGHANVPIHFLSGDFSKSVAGVEQMIQQFSPSMLAVDAAYLLTAEGQNKGYISKWESISAVIGQLKTLAIRYGIPIIITVQLNRNVKNRQTREVDLADVAGSDSIPQDASILVAIRDGVAPYERSRRLLQMLKNRDGDIRDFQTHFSFAPCSFDEVPEDTYMADMSWMV